MGLSEIMAKSNPAKGEREMKNSEYLKLVDRNTELVDELKENKSRTDKAIEYIELWHYRNDFRVNSFTKGVKEELLEILKGSDKVE